MEENFKRINNGDKIISEENNETYVLTIKKKHFPWWIFLLLLPLVLLIKCNKDIVVNCQDNRQNAIPNQSVTLKYQSYFIWNQGFMKNDSVIRTAKTDDNGNATFTALPYSVYSYLFFRQEKVKVYAFNECFSGSDTTKLFHSTDRINLVLGTQTINAKIKLQDITNNQPLSQGKITIIENNQNLNANANGEIDIKNLNLCSEISLKGSCTGYYDSLVSNIKVKDIAQNNYILRLRPIKKEEPKKEEPKKQEPKKEEPKKEEPKKEEPKKQEPKQEELKGQNGDLRINLQWYCKADLDLIVKDPCGGLTYYDRKRSTCKNSRGSLDIDANQNATNEPWKASTSPQENMFWTNPTEGKYTIAIKCCPFHRQMNLKSNKIEFTLTIQDARGRIDKRGSISENDSLIFTSYDYVKNF